MENWHNFVDEYGFNITDKKKKLTRKITKAIIAMKL